MSATLLWKGMRNGTHYRVGTKPDGHDRLIVVERMERDAFGGERWMVMTGGRWCDEQEIQHVIAAALETMFASIEKRAKAER